MKSNLSKSIRAKYHRFDPDNFSNITQRNVLYLAKLQIARLTEWLNTSFAYSIGNTYNTSSMFLLFLEQRALLLKISSSVASVRLEFPAFTSSGTVTPRALTFNEYLVATRLLVFLHFVHRHRSTVFPYHRTRKDARVRQIRSKIFTIILIFTRRFAYFPYNFPGNFSNNFPRALKFPRFVNCLLLSPRIFNRCFLSIVHTICVDRTVIY